MKLQISQTEINDFYDSLKTKNVGEQIVLDKRTLDVLIAVFGTVAFIAQLLKQSGKIRVPTKSAWIKYCQQS